MYKYIRVDSIKIPKRLRRTDPDKVKLLAASIKASDLLQPIVVTRKHVLCAGKHRLEAVKSLGRSVIKCYVVSNRMNALLIEIDENLVRSNLSELEECVQLHIRETQAHGSATFKTAIAQLTGVGKRTIERKLRIGKCLIGDYTKLLDSPVAHTQSCLLQLCALQGETFKRTVNVLHERRADTTRDARKLAEMEIMGELTGAPLMPANRDEVSTSQFNFQLLPAQRTLVERAITESIKQGRKEQPKPKASHANALARICAFYLKSHLRS